MKEKPYVKVAMYALNIIFAIIIIVPVIYCFNVSMMDLKEIYGGRFWPSHLTIENYTRAFQLAPFFTFIKNSLIVSGVITAAQVITGALAAYAFAMMEFKGKKVLFYIMLATMMIPSQAIIIANYLTIADWGIRNTYAADGVNFEIKKGEFVVIVGPSGAGKTTILNILGGMDTVTSGEVIVDGVHIES